MIFLLRMAFLETSINLKLINGTARDSEGTKRDPITKVDGFVIEAAEASKLKIIWAPIAVNKLPVM